MFPFLHLTLPGLWRTPSQCLTFFSHLDSLLGCSHIIAEVRSRTSLVSLGIPPLLASMAPSIQSVQQSSYHSRVASRPHSGLLRTWTWKHALQVYNEMICRYFTLLLPEPHLQTTTCAACARLIQDNGHVQKHALYTLFACNCIRLADDLVTQS